MDTQQLKKSLDKAKVEIIKDSTNVFISSILFSLKFHWVDEKHQVQTAGTNGIDLYMNTKFWSALTGKEQVGLLLHEAWHVACEHMLRRGGRNPNKWNVAADHFINVMLKDSGHDLPEGGVWDFKYRGMCTEDIYLDLPEQEESDGDVLEPGEGSGEGDNGEGSDSSSGKPGQYQEAMAQHSTEDVEAAIEEAIMRAANEAQLSEQWGTVPGHLQRRVNEINNPQLDWRTVLQNYMHSYAKNDYSYQRPNRRFFPDYYMPSLFSEGMGNVSVIIDTSGSVSEKEFNELVCEAKAIKETLNPESIHFMTFDTSLYDIAKFQRDEDIGHMEMQGGGGTDIAPVLNHVKESSAEVTIIFTDGYFRKRNIIPESDVIWVIYGNDNFEADFGRIIKYSPPK